MWTWIRSGVEHSLDTGTFCYFLGHDGAGMVPFHRLTERGPLQHGATDRGYRLDPRTLMLSVAISADSEPEYYTRVGAMIDAFKPLNVPGIVRWESSGVRLQIDGYLVDGLGFESKNRRGWNHREVVAIKCDDPTWYDPVAVAVTFALGADSGGTLVPTPVPTPVGGDSLSDARVIVYAGKIATYPTLIRITGPWTDPVITNATIGEKFDFTGFTIAGGSYYDIILSNPTSKRVVNQLGANKYQELSNDSSLATWRIEADPIAADGINEVQVTGSGLTSASKIDIIYLNRYPSIGVYA